MRRVLAILICCTFLTPPTRGDDPIFETDGETPVSELGGLIILRHGNQTTWSLGGVFLPRKVQVVTATPAGPVGAFYEAFDPATAWSPIRRLEFRHAPKHGSWLNVAENELSALTRQCVNGRRFALIGELREETAAWHKYINDKQRGVDWQFRIDDARTKLKSLDPKIKG